MKRGCFLWRHAINHFGILNSLLFNYEIMYVLTRTFHAQYMQSWLIVTYLSRRTERPFLCTHPLHKCPLINADQLDMAAQNCNPSAQGTSRHINDLFTAARKWKFQHLVQVPVNFLLRPSSVPSTVVLPDFHALPVSYD